MTMVILLSITTVHSSIHSNYHLVIIVERIIWFDSIRVSFICFHCCRRSIRFGLFIICNQYIILTMDLFLIFISSSIFDDDAIDCGCFLGLWRCFWIGTVRLVDSSLMVYFIHRRFFRIQPWDWYCFSQPSIPLSFIKNCNASGGISSPRALLLFVLVTSIRNIKFPFLSASFLLVRDALSLFRGYLSVQPVEFPFSPLRGRFRILSFPTRWYPF